MSPKTAASTSAAGERYLIGTVASKDGTTIGYRQLGRGPGVVVLHGSLSTGLNHLQLGEALAGSFTVYIPDRRGRGLSSPDSWDFSTQRDIEDLDALLAKTGAHNLFGVSVGSIICLKAALVLPAIHKLAAYEPPLFTNGAEPVAFLKRFDQEMARGDVAAALVTSMKAAPLVSRMVSAMPSWLLEKMTKKMISWERGKGPDDYLSFKELAPTLHHDGQVIGEMSGKQESLRAIRTEVLLLGGSRSTAFLKTALDSVAKVLPQARRVVFPGLNHSSSWNADLRGNPEPIAAELRRFFS